MNKTVLVVDDSPLILDTVANMLELDGYRVLIESLPERAAEHCARGNVDLMLCDVCWDTQQTGDSITIGLDAILSCRRIFPTLPIVAMSGLLRAEDLQNLARFGVAGALTKPFQLEELYSVIETALQWQPPAPNML
jgi:CheY-like chemotaxis protein